MKKIIYLPFENLPQRYTKMWNDAITEQLSGKDITVWVDDTEQKIQEGEFLDTFGTTKYKAKQLAAIAELFAAKRVEDGDIFFVPDVFYCGLESIRYMADLAGIEVKIVSFNHAGYANPYDFIHKAEARWGIPQEKIWHQISNKVLVGSLYHKRSVVSMGFCAAEDVVKTGAVWSSTWMDKMTESIRATSKEDYIIYPHRPAPEKNFDLFLQIAKLNPDLKFIITSSGKSRIDTDLPNNVSYLPELSKKDYFRIFSAARGYLSTALQETFGYTVQEAIYFGCSIVAPNFACYPEFLHPASLVEFKDMTKPNFLTTLYNEKPEELKQSKQFPDNAKTILKQIRYV